jgi:hypothetical protein
MKVSTTIDPPTPYYPDERSNDASLVRCLYCMEYFKWEGPTCEHLSIGWQDKMKKWRETQRAERRREKRAEALGQDDQGGGPPPQGELFNG